MHIRKVARSSISIRRIAVIASGKEDKYIQQWKFQITCCFFCIYGQSESTEMHAACIRSMQRHTAIRKY